MIETMFMLLIFTYFYILYFCFKFSKLHFLKPIGCTNYLFEMKNKWIYTFYSFIQILKFTPPLILTILQKW